MSFWSTHVYISSVLEDVFKVLGNVSFHLPYKEHSVLLRNPKEDWAGSPSLSSRPGILISHMTMGKWPVYNLFSSSSGCLVRLYSTPLDGRDDLFFFLTLSQLLRVSSSDNIRFFENYRESSFCTSQPL